MLLLIGIIFSLKVYEVIFRILTAWLQLLVHATRIMLIGRYIWQLVVLEYKEL